ncbi:MAG: SAM-dependent chlorinase/fluorinase [Candidatus Absconditabacterales bacterium]|nr:SAM-dependent chlorinase/fluorinase [Candidatus Absconditabacterales bacterium]
MHITIITDCCDANATARQVIRANTLFLAPATVIGIDPSFETLSDLEAGGHLVDCLDASCGEPSVILVNKAPRSGPAKKRPNGTPFGYFWVGKTLVCTSIDGYVLSLIKKCGISDHITIWDIPTVMNRCCENGLCDKTLADHIIATQFRSFEFLPRVAKWVRDGRDVPATETSLDYVPDAGSRVWFVDIFGNCKTTIAPQDCGRQAGKQYRLGQTILTATTRLKDLPNGEIGLVIGSSGYGQHRRCEIMIQGGSAAAHLGIGLGSEIVLEPVM